MLSRTASSLFWMGRYMERAENLARLLDVCQQLAMMPEASESILAMPLEAIEQQDVFAKSERPLTHEEVAYFLMLSPDTPSSIYSSLQMARYNAHVVRGAITSELWESVNATWLEMQQTNRLRIRHMGQAQFLEWVKERAHIYRGILVGTSQRNEAYLFARLGMVIERADNTTRLLRYHLTALSGEDQQERSAYYAWATLLRALSAYEAYRDSYSSSMKVAQVGELLMLRQDLPRSLLACCLDVASVLDRINGPHSRAVRRVVAEVLAQLRFASWESDFAEDPVAALDELLSVLGEIGSAIEATYWSAE